MNKNEVKNKIRAIDPRFSDELLDLLHEYFKTDYQDQFDQMKSDVEFKELINNIILQ